MKKKGKPRGAVFTPEAARKARAAPGSGRAKGQPNHVTLEVKELSRRLVTDPEYLDNLRVRLIAGELAGQMETTLWHYAYGKPKETVAVEGAKDLTLNVFLSDGSSPS